MRSELTLMSVVQDAFQITGRGVVVVPGVPHEPKWRLKVGDRLTLKRPDGTVLSSSVRGLEMGLRVPTTSTAVLLGQELSKADVPVGTELWANRDSES